MNRRFGFLGAILIFLLAACQPNAAYDKPAIEVEGKTPLQKIASIAEKINLEYGDAVSVTKFEFVSSNAGNKVARYSLRIVVPEKILMGQPTTQQEANRQAELYGMFTSSLSDLLKLSAIHLVEKDPTLSGISILVVFPDDQIVQLDSTSEQLRIINRDPEAQTDMWLATVKVTSMTLVDEETWAKIQELLANASKTEPAK